MPTKKTERKDPARDALAKLVKLCEKKGWSYMFAISTDAHDPNAYTTTSTGCPGRWALVQTVRWQADILSQAAKTASK